MATTKQPRKVIRASSRLPYGGDEKVDRVTGISTENHHDIWRRLAQGLRHGAPGPRKPRKQS